MKMLFLKFDEDSDGTISTSELGKFLASSLHQNFSEQEIKDMIKEVDANGNGKLEFNEFFNLFLALFVEDEKEEETFEKPRDLFSLLSSPDRDYLINNKGQRININSLKQNQVIGLYFSASWCPPSRHFTPDLEKTYREIKSQLKRFEIIFVSGDRNENECQNYLSHMPWLAIPYSDRKANSRIANIFGVQGYPTLLLIDNNGQLITSEGRSLILQYGAKGFPFTKEKLAELKR